MFRNRLRLLPRPLPVSSDEDELTERLGEEGAGRVREERLGRRALAGDFLGAMVLVLPSGLATGREGGMKEGRGEGGMKGGREGGR